MGQRKQQSRKTSWVTALVLGAALVVGAPTVQADEVLADPGSSPQAWQELDAYRGEELPAWLEGIVPVDPSEAAEVRGEYVYGALGVGTGAPNAAGLFALNVQIWKGVGWEAGRLISTMQGYPDPGRFSSSLW